MLKAQHVVAFSAGPFDLGPLRDRLPLAEYIRLHRAFRWGVLMCMVVPVGYEVAEVRELVPQAKRLPPWEPRVRA